MDSAALGRLIAGGFAVYLMGIALGLLGAGGTAIAVPVLVYIVGLDAHAAIAVSIALVGAASALGAWLHSRKGALRLKPGLAFATPGILGAWLGSRWSYLLSGRALLLMFGSLLLLIAAKMLLEKRSQAALARPTRIGWAAAAGLGIGVLTGLLGVGGGFAIVPALYYLGGLSMRESIATSLLVICINSSAAFAGHLSQFRPDPFFLFALLGCASLGMISGTVISHRTDPARLKHAFALLLAALALFILVKNF